MDLFLHIYMVFGLLNGLRFQTLNFDNKKLTSTYQINATNARNILRINMRYNDLKTLETGNLILFTSLTSLDVSYNKISQIRNGTFNRLNRLRILMIM